MKTPKPLSLRHAVLEYSQLHMYLNIVCFIAVRTMSVNGVFHHISIDHMILLTSNYLVSLVKRLCVRMKMITWRVMPSHVQTPVQSTVASTVDDTVIDHYYCVIPSGFLSTEEFYSYILRTYLPTYNHIYSNRKLQYLHSKI